MQVVLGWSSNSGTGNIQDSISTYSSLPNIGTGDVTTWSSKCAPIAAIDIKNGLSKDAKRIREQLKMVKVYVLAQEGNVIRDIPIQHPVL